MNKDYFFTRKPKSCPVCKSTKIANILYGMPVYNEKFANDMDSGKIVIGGCCITDNDPKWQCVDCNIELFKKQN